MKILGRRMVFRSLMTSHNPGLEVYNADAAHCLPAVATEMLADSRPGIVELLPALPAEWRSGSLRGIATRARVTVGELSWDLDEGVVRAVLTSALEQQVTLAAGVPGRPPTSGSASAFRRARRSASPSGCERRVPREPAPVLQLILAGATWSRKSRNSCVTICCCGLFAQLTCH